MTYQQIQDELRLTYRADHLAWAVEEHAAMHKRCLDQIAEMGAKLKEWEEFAKACEHPPVFHEDIDPDASDDWLQSQLLSEILSVLKDIRNNQVLD